MAKRPRGTQHHYPTLRGKWPELEEHWPEAGTWLGFEVFGSTLPLSLTFLAIIAGFTPGSEISALANDGQFALYASAFFASALYFITREHKSFKPFSQRPRLSLVAMVGLVLSSGLYMLWVTSTAPPEETSFWKHVVAFSLFAGSIMVSYVSAAFDNQRIAADPKTLRSAQDNSFEADFDRTLTGAGNE